MAARQENVPVQLADGVRMYVEATRLGRDESVAFKVPLFEDVTNTLTFPIRGFGEHLCVFLTYTP